MSKSLSANILLITYFRRCAVLASVASAEAILDEEKNDTRPFHTFSCETKRYTSFQLFISAAFTCHSKLQTSK